MDAKRPEDQPQGNKAGNIVPAVRLIAERSRQHSQEIPAVFRPDEAAASFRPNATSSQ